jgi:replication factor C subunit 3/5
VNFINNNNFAAEFYTQIFLQFLNFKFLLKMALWLDKYRPKKLSKLDFHRRQAEHLEQLVKGGDFPHLLVYGPPGSGKKTRIMALLRELYGSGVERLRIEHQNFETPSKKKLEIVTIASNYHIEVSL